MLRRNKDTGRMERLVDGQWVPAVDVEDTGDMEPAGTRPSAIGVAEESADSSAVQWSEIEAAFADVGADQAVYVDEAYQGREATLDAVRALAAGGDAGRDLGVPGPGAGTGDSALVSLDAGPGSDGLGVAPGGADSESDDLGYSELPGLTTGGARGQRGVLQRLRDRKRSSRGARNTRESVPAPVQGAAPLGTGVEDKRPARSAQKIEVPEGSARPRGPAVRDSTEARQAAQVRAKARPEPGRISTKPAPEIISDQPRWVRDLFEAHFRSSRTLELRHMPIGKSGKNRMKMSRADFSIGWLVLLEAARRSPEILRLKSDGSNS